MNQLGTIIMVMLGLVMLSYAYGYIDPSASGVTTVIGYLINPTGINIMDLVISGIAAGGAAALISLFVQKDLRLSAGYIMAGLVLDIFMAFNSVITNIFAIAPAAAYIFLSPIMVYSAFLLFDYWRGTD